MSRGRGREPFDLRQAYEELTALYEAGDHEGWVDRAWEVVIQCPIMFNDIYRLAMMYPPTVVSYMATLVLFEAEARARRREVVEQMERDVPRGTQKGDEA